MAHQIRINPNALRAAASRQREIGEMVQEIRLILRNQAARLDMAWDSNSSSRAVNALMSSAAAVGHIGEAIAENSRKIDSVADIFENADKNASGSNGPRLNPDIINEAAQLTRRSGLASGLSITAEDGLSVDTQALRVVSSRCDDAADRLWDLSRNLESLMDTLAADWEGRAYDRFAQDTQIMTDSLRRCTESLRETADQISYAAYRYEEMDAALS